MDAYAAPRWLPGGHAQTVWPLLLKGELPAYRRERWNTPDHDFIDLDWADGNLDGDLAAPLLVLFHGLEGSSRSHYARALMRAVGRRGWRGVVVHFRGCSGEANVLPRAYHSGDSAEVDWVLKRLRGEHDGPLFAAGVSLGANCLLKWLGEQGDAARNVVAAAAAVSAPLDLAAANESLSCGVNRLYARHFLRTLIPAALAKLARFPGLFLAGDVLAARTLAEFDEAVTAPLHGFRGAADYYAQSSAGQFLGGVRVPTLVINSRNDPFLPAASLPEKSQLPDAILLETPEAGGHVGFIGGGFPGNLDWLPQRLLEFFQQEAGKTYRIQPVFQHNSLS